MNNDIRKYIDIITESAGANISKIAKNIISGRESYFLSKEINVPINTSIILDHVEIYRSSRALSVDLLFKGEIYDDWHRKQLEKIVKDYIKPVLIGIGFSEEASNADAVPQILSKTDEVISLSFNPSDVSFQKLVNEFDRAARHKQSMDDLS